MELDDTKVTCNYCREAFEPRMLSTKLASKETMHYMSCPHCSAQFNINITTPSGMKMLERLRRLAKSGKTETPNYRRTLKRYQANVRKPEVREVPPKR